MNKLTLPLAVAALALSSEAHAQMDDGLLKPARDARANYFFELRFGPYRPDVDAAFGAVKPYQKVFGDDTRYMLGAEFDWTPIHLAHFGTLGVGGQLGYTSATANAQFADGSGASAEDTKFALWMFSALAVLRIDALAKDTWIPLVPYAKVGPSVGLWEASNGLGTSEVDGVIGKGKTYGLTYAVGALLLLDFLDRQAAKTFDAEQGVRHTYLLGEYVVADVNGAGQSSAMRVGDKTWALGLAMEF
jgi:hypothetical protein